MPQTKNKIICTCIRNQHYARIKSKKYDYGQSNMQLIGRGDVCFWCGGLIEYKHVLCNT
jgi:hypothetical protein